MVRLLFVLYLQDDEPNHPTGINNRLAPWTPNLSNGNPHPNLDQLIRNGAGIVANNHPNLDVICQIMMPVLAISGIHPNIEVTH